jgi:hypothetical protein
MSEDAMTAARGDDAEAGPLAEVPARAAYAHVPLPRMLPALRWWHFLFFAAAYLYAFPYFDKLRSAQEMPRLLLTQQVVERHVLYLDDRLGHLGSGNDLSKGPDGRSYANKSPGPSFVAAPVYWFRTIFGRPSLKGAMWAMRVGAITLPALLFLPFFYWLLRRFTPDENARRAALAAYALASPVVPYSMLLYSHMLAATCLGGAFAISVYLVRGRPSRPLLLAALAGVLAGMAPAMDYQATLAAPLIWLYVLICSRPRIRRAAVFAAGAVPPLVGMLTYHKLCFGSPFRISYSLGVDTAPQKGLLGFIGPNWDSFRNTLFEPSNGLIIMSPWVLLGLVGAIAILTQRRLRLRMGAEALLCAGIVTVYVLFVGSMLPYMARGGWSAGARQLVGMLPFLTCLAAVGFEAAGRFLVTRALAFASVLAGAVIFFAVATTYPHWPDSLRNPLYELSFRLLGQGYAVHSLGTAIGLHGLWSLAPLYLLVLGWISFLLAGGVRRGVLVLGLAGVLATGFIAGYGRAPQTGAYSEKVWGWVTATWEPPRR